MTIKMSGGPIKAERIQSKLRSYRGWQYDEPANCIHRTYQFPTFPAAIRFVAFVAELAEAADHHPDIDIRYDKVKIALSTHSAGGVTDRDFSLAASIDQR
jgi:4a-hydroxytetrahydrobiopterin dehydratase